jgi:hypothetical protein
MGERSYIFSLDILREVKTGAPRLSVPKVGIMAAPLKPEKKAAFATIFAAVMAP